MTIFRQIGVSRSHCSSSICSGKEPLRIAGRDVTEHSKIYICCIWILYFKSVGFGCGFVNTITAKVHIRLLSTHWVSIYLCPYILNTDVWDYPGEPVPEETFTPSPILIIIQHLSASSIHGIVPVQLTCLTIFFHNLSPSPVWSTSWYGALHLILHTFLHPISVFSHTIAACFAVVPRLYHLFLISLNSLSK